MIKVKLKKCDDDSWISGTVGIYDFNAKVFDESSYYGIDGGRVSKLSIYDKKKDWSQGLIMNYDRGWDVKPSDENMKYYDAVMKFIETKFKNF